MVSGGDRLWLHRLMEGHEAVRAKLQERRAQREERVNEYDYRERCIKRLIEIVIDLQDDMGFGRLFIP
jgi:hypothetical protein